MNIAGIGLAVSQGFIGNQALMHAVRYDEFLTKAIAVGMSKQQAEKIFRNEVPKGGDFGDTLQRAEDRLHWFLENGSLPVLLDEVLTPQELSAQPFSAGTLLNGWRWMRSPYGQQFSEMDPDRQRGLVLAAIELTRELGGTEQGWPLERAMAAVMPHKDARAGQ